MVICLWVIYSIDRSKIIQIDSKIILTETDKVIDAKGLTLLPGVIDPQVHFREPGLEHKEDLATSSRACAKVALLLFGKCPTPAL